ncbi:MAG TPA: hypothetical protein VL993_11070 [Stellaceae bacterium]|nr:hypothetical protein [Stellaceae bacterium]
MRRYAAAAATMGVMMLGAVAAPAQEAAPSLATVLQDNTLAADMFLPRERGGNSLDRVMFQAYLRANGTALVRRWDAPHDAYTAPAEAHWSVTGSTLCMNFPGFEVTGDICIELHVWGPRIAGNSTGTGPFALLDGNIEPGNSLVATR